MKENAINGCVIYIQLLKVVFLKRTSLKYNLLRVHLQTSNNKYLLTNLIMPMFKEKILHSACKNAYCFMSNRHLNFVCNLTETAYILSKFETI